MKRATLNLSIEELERKAHELRIDIVKMIGLAGSGHPGGSLSAIDIITALFFRIMRHDPQNPRWPDRDRFVLSKGHAAPALYAALAHAGYFERDLLWTLRKIGSPLQGHPDKRKLPILEASTGSLGQGLSIGIGIALAGKLDRKNYRVYVLLGDGETQEGQIWEGALFARQHKLDNITAIVDYNKFQLDGPLKDILDIEPYRDKWRAFGWEVFEIDGHNMREIVETIERTKEIKGKPSVVIAHTIKGKGVSFMENNNDFHGKAPTKEQLELALKELGADERI